MQHCSTNECEHRLDTRIGTDEYSLIRLWNEKVDVGCDKYKAFYSFFFCGAYRYLHLVHVCASMDMGIKRRRVQNWK